MDDRELEARLSRHLHARLDAAPVPVALASAVRQGIDASPTARVGFTLRPRALQLGWATIAIVVVVGGYLLYGNGAGPANPGVTVTASPGATASAGGGRAFIVLPPPGTTDPVPGSARAGDVIKARLSALGLQNYAIVGGTAFAVYGPADGPSDDEIRAVLAATGDVQFVPLRPAILGNVDPQTLIGKQPPSGATALFGSDGIASVKRGVTVTQGLRTIEISLTPAATALFGDYTTRHTTEYVAITIDGKIAVVPLINEPITGGQVAVSAGGPVGIPNSAFDVAAAILVGGRLPASWEGAQVPEVMTRDAAIAAARISVGDGQGKATVVSADLDANPGDTGWQPIWVVVLENIPGRDSTSTMKVIMDATGQ